MSAKQYKTLGEDLWRQNGDKIRLQNAELFTLTYGALVVQLIKDYEDYALVNGQLDKMGYNIGTRLIEEFLAKSNLPRCSDLREAAEVISKVGFKMFLNITPNVVFPLPSAPGAGTPARSGDAATPAALGAFSGPNPASAASGSDTPNQEFGLVFTENPLAEFVELPPEALRGGLWYSNVLAGVLRGALEMVQIQAECAFVSDTLRGDDQTEIRVRLQRFLEEQAPPADD
ncbi:hypothetical protein MSPP1_004076 [Malassezia sp. CBS 17886]|nr:hypothetical protein MSPP1_004076 [Malassezia sp. CBS 17886]